MFGSTSFKITTFVLTLLLLQVFFYAQANDPNQLSFSRCSVRNVIGPVRGMLVSDADKVYVGTVDGVLNSFEAGDLSVIWRSELGGEFVSEAVPLDNGIIVVTNPAVAENSVRDGSMIRFVGKDSGLTVWTAKLPFSGKYYVSRLNGGVVAISQEGIIVLIEAASGRIKWQSAALGSITTKLSSTADRVAFGTAEKFTYVVSAKQGEVLLKQPIDHVPTAVYLAANGGVLTGDERGNVALWTAQGGKPIWRFKSGAAVSSVVEANDGVLLTSFDNFIYFISDYNGDVIWKRRLPARLVDGGLILDNLVVALIGGENSGYIMQLEKGKVLGILPSLERELISLSPVLVRGRKFALTTVDSVETYEVGQCSSK